MGADQLQLRPHEATTDFGLDPTTRKTCLRIRCSCGWVGPDHDLAADTHEAVMDADEKCQHDFRVHLGWRRIELPVTWAHKLPR